MDSDCSSHCGRIDMVGHGSDCDDAPDPSVETGVEAGLAACAKACGLDDGVNGEEGVPNPVEPAASSMVEESQAVASRMEPSTRALPRSRTTTFDDREFVELHPHGEHRGYSINCSCCGIAKDCSFISTSGVRLFSPLECRQRLSNWELACTGDGPAHRKAGKRLLVNFK